MTDRVEVQFGAVLNEFTAGVGQVKSQLESLIAPVASLQGAFTGLAAAAGAWYAIDKVEEFIASMTEAGETALKMSSTLALSVGQATEFGNLMKSIGGSAETAMRPLERLAAAIGQALTNPVSMQAQAFRALGISLEEVRAHANDTQGMLELLRQRFQALGDSMAKTNDFRILLGRGFDELIPYLRKTDEEVAALNARIADTGANFGRPIAEGMEQTGENAQILSLAFKGLGITLFEAFKPAIDATVNGLAELIEGFNDAAQSGSVLHDALTALVLIVDSLLAAIGTLALGFKLLWQYGAAAFEYMIEEANTAGTVLEDIFSGHFAQAKADAEAGLTSIQQSLYDHYGNMISDAVEWAASINKLYSNIGMEGVDTSGGPGGAPGAPKPQAGTVGSTVGGAGGNEGAAMLAQWRDQLDQKLIDEKKFFADSKTEELAYWQVKLALAESSTNRLGLADKEYAELHLALQRQVYALDKSAAQEWLSSYKAGIDEQLSDLKSQLQAREISEADYYRQSAALAENWIDTLQRLDLEGTSQYQNALKQRNALDGQYAKATAIDWGAGFTYMSNQFDEITRGILQGTQTWRQALARSASDMIASFAAAVLKMLAQWAVFEAATAAGWAKMATSIGNPFAAGAGGLGGAVGNLFGAGAGASGDGTQKLVDATTAQTAATTQNTTGITSWIGQQIESLTSWLGLTTSTTAQTAATTADTAATSGGLIPAMALMTAALGVNTAALGASSMANAGGGVLKLPFFDVGAYRVPYNMVAAIHQDEMIIPAADAAMVRAGQASIGAGGVVRSGGESGGAGAPQSVAFSPQINALDGKSVIAVLNDPATMRQLVKNIGTYMSNNPSTRGPF